MAEIRDLINQLNSVIRTDKVDRRVLITVHQTMTERIFEEGKDANNQQIGTYSDAYMERRRQMNYPDNRKVILQATRQMVNDFELIVESKGKYGSGFKNNANYEKSLKVERTFGKDIFSLTSQEQQLLATLFEKELEREFNR